jgi:hypothetical protein
MSYTAGAIKSEPTLALKAPLEKKKTEQLAIRLLDS